MALAGAVLEGFDVINIGTATHYAILDLLEEIFKSSMGGLMLSKAARQTGGRQEPRRRPQQVSERLNWVPSYTCAKEVERTTNWYLDAFGPRDATIERLLMERN